MSDKNYRWLVAGISVSLAVVIGLFFGKITSGQKNERTEQMQAKLVLAPKAQLPREDARWTFAPDVQFPSDTENSAVRLCTGRFEKRKMKSRRE
jgi:hypothetical protein